MKGESSPLYIPAPWGMLGASGLLQSCSSPLVLLPKQRPWGSHVLLVDVALPSPGEGRLWKNSSYPSFIPWLWDSIPWVSSHAFSESLSSELSG